MMNNNKYLHFPLMLVFFVVFCHKTYSQSQQVPFHIQAAFFEKILKHISPLRDVNPVKVLIVYDKKTESEKNILKENMKNLAFTVYDVLPSQLILNISQCNVVYFMPGSQEYAKLCRDNQVLSICGINDYVEENLISLAIGVEQDKPKIYINFRLLQAEGNDVSAGLLKISRVYR